jgi:hypothetical protein
VDNLRAKVLLLAAMPKRDCRERDLRDRGRERGDERERERERQRERDGGEGFVGSKSRVKPIPT